MDKFTISNQFTTHYPGSLVNAIQGNKEMIAETTKAVRISQIVFGACVVGAVAAIAFSASPILIGALGVTATIAAISWKINSEWYDMIDFWKQGLDLLNVGKVDLAADHLKFALKKYNENSKPAIPRILDYILDEKNDTLITDDARYGYFSLDVRDAYTEGGNYLIHDLLGQALLLQAIHKVKNEDPSDEEYQNIQDDIKIADQILMRVRCGIRDYQRDLINIFNFSKQEAKEKLEQADIVIPTKFSHGRQLLVEVCYWSHQFIVPSEHHQHKEYAAQRNQRLYEAFTTNLNKAKACLVESGEYTDDSIEKELIDKLLNAKEPLEFHQIVKSDFDDRAEVFEDRVATA